MGRRDSFPKSSEEGILCSSCVHGVKRSIPCGCLVIGETLFARRKGLRGCKKERQRRRKREGGRRK